MKTPACTECGVLIEGVTTARFCPGCGSQIASNTKKKTSPIVKFFLWFMGIGLATAMILDKRAPQPAPSGSRSPTETTTADVRASDRRVEAISGGDGRLTTEVEQACFDKGADIAGVFFDNIKQATEAGMRSSDMMERGCQQAVGNQGSWCVLRCTDGFRHLAKNWAKK